jgi:hypothetical protein
MGAARRGCRHGWRLRLLCGPRASPLQRPAHQLALLLQLVPLRLQARAVALGRVRAQRLQRQVALRAARQLLQLLRHQRHLQGARGQVCGDGVWGAVDTGGPVCPSREAGRLGGCVAGRRGGAGGRRPAGASVPGSYACACPPTTQYKGTDATRLATPAPSAANAGPHSRPQHSLEQRPPAGAPSATAAGACGGTSPAASNDEQIPPGCRQPASAQIPAKARAASAIKGRRGVRCLLRGTLPPKAGGAHPEVPARRRLPPQRLGQPLHRGAAAAAAAADLRQAAPCALRSAPVNLPQHCHALQASTPE